MYLPKFYVDRFKNANMLSFVKTEWEPCVRIWERSLKEIVSCRQYFGVPRWLSGKASAHQCRKCRRCRFDPWIRKIPWRSKWQPTPVFLPGESDGYRSLVGYSLWAGKESDMTQWLSTISHLWNSSVKKSD